MTMTHQVITKNEKRKTKNWVLASLVSPINFSIINAGLIIQWFTPEEFILLCLWCLLAYISIVSFTSILSNQEICQIKLDWNLVFKMMDHVKEQYRISFRHSQSHKIIQCHLQYRLSIDLVISKSRLILFERILFQK